MRNLSGLRQFKETASFHYNGDPKKIKSVIKNSRFHWLFWVEFYEYNEFAIELDAIVGTNHPSYSSLYSFTYPGHIEWSGDKQPGNRPLSSNGHLEGWKRKEGDTKIYVDRHPDRNEYIIGADGNNRVLKSKWDKDSPLYIHVCSRNTRWNILYKTITDICSTLYFLKNVDLKLFYNSRQGGNRFTKDLLNAYSVVIEISEKSFIRDIEFKIYLPLWDEMKTFLTKLFSLLREHEKKNVLMKKFSILKISLFMRNIEHSAVRRELLKVIPCEIRKTVSFMMSI